MPSHSPLLAGHFSSPFFAWNHRYFSGIVTFIFTCAGRVCACYSSCARVAPGHWFENPAACGIALMPGSMRPVLSTPRTGVEMTFADNSNSNCSACSAALLPRLKFISTFVRRVQMFSIRRHPDRIRLQPHVWASCVMHAAGSIGGNANQGYDLVSPDLANGSGWAGSGVGQSPRFPCQTRCDPQQSDFTPHLRRKEIKFSRGISAEFKRPRAVNARGVPP